MRIVSIILISTLIFVGCGKSPTTPLPKPITPVGTGGVVDLIAPSVSGEIQSHTGK